MSDALTSASDCARSTYRAHTASSARVDSRAGRYPSRDPPRERPWWTDRERSMDSGYARGGARLHTFASRAELQGTFGMVASTHWLASAAGMSVLERGGNAFGAAVAGGFVLQAVEPNDHGPGGDLVALVSSAGDGRVRVVCGQGPAPGGATIEHFRRLDLDMVPRNGMLAPCVPGVVGAWLLVLGELGTWRLRDVLDGATGWAADG